MTSITPAARLKVKEDTFFLPVPDEGVYFRNNVGTFRMEGAMIDRWIEKLVPMFNGEHTMADLTNGLSSPHLERVYEIAEVLYRKGFVRDVSQDIPHQLTDGIMKKFAGQIAFLESFGDSGAYRFQCYRQADVLAVGSGPMFVSLVAALLESGLPKIHMLITESVPTNRERIVELANQARRTDPEVEVREIEQRKEGADGWREMVEPYQSIVYVSQKGDIDEFRLLHDVCKTEKKLLLPAMCLHQTGMAGPVVHPGSEGCWESAWRRVHPASVWKDPELHSFSTTAGAMLANVIVFELFKSMTGQSEPRNSFFLLDLETLEGSWHSFIPHPMVNGFETNRAIQAPDLQLDGREETLVQGDPNRLLSYMSRLTSPQSGILHLWEEGDLRQLPLSQCRVQAVDPLSEGPAALLPEQIGVGLTHEEARREAGLLGIEAYVARWAEKLVHTNEVIGIGAGATRAEGIVRGLQAHLSQQQSMQLRKRVPSAARVPAGRVEDERCRYYLQQLSAWRRDPVIAFGEEIAGFPAVWVGFGDGWYGGSGLNKTAALRKALQGALLGLQNGSVPPADQVQTASSVRIVREVPGEITFPSIEGWSHSRSMQEALETISSQGKQLFVVDLAVEPFLKEELQGVFGVLLREGGSR
ncbi:putative thiazole-containing bacteriocin maturation protein [Paenibacillus sp. OAS669]|uniref:putative thiazole-containing bacteriocin maturation protein n=1 Tax=Paenibacillus sp. OAS669 TaxID=2663821 RepID=UPI00178B1E30|nr:putative thiazole-containing bacteriocin maturation protein [Paenibacillus sp. OAS669]MBE1446781.1 putative thiazole-containing bacteriocin maturation protein [Paenibacillus sp. OAS669]